jgi:hypothetical protein
MQLNTTESDPIHFQSLAISRLYGVVMKTNCRPKKQNTNSKSEKALDVFIHEVGSARELVTLIRRFLDEHLETAPDEVNWANVGDAARIRAGLQEIAQTFNLN